MAEVATTTRKQSLQMAGVIVGTVFTFNTLFYVASSFYFDGKSTTDINAVRIAFATMSFVIAALTFAAALAPRLIGHGLATVLGFASIAGGVSALSTSLPAVMGITLLGAGALICVLAWRSWHHSRAAWAFLTAMIVVFGTVDFFGAPKIRTLLGINLWHALIIPGMQFVCVMALAMVRGEYRESP